VSASRNLLRADFAALLAFHNAVARYLCAWLRRSGACPAGPYPYQAPESAYRIAQPVDLVFRRRLDLRHYSARPIWLLIGNPDSPLRWILPALILVAAIAGVIAAFTLKRRSPGCTSRWVGIATLS
jgi:hypothetical protein